VGSRMTTAHVKIRRLALFQIAHRPLTMLAPFSNTFVAGSHVAGRG
jgi:hypothetical protein